MYGHEEGDEHETEQNEDSGTEVADPLPAQYGSNLNPSMECCNSTVTRDCRILFTFGAFS